MITVISLFQFQHRFLFAHFLRNGKPFYVSRHPFQHFLLRNATNGSVRLVHTDIRDIVQLAEDAELRELGDAGQKHESQIGITRLQRTVKVAHHIAQYREILLLVHHIQQGRVILVDEDYHLAVGLFAGTHDECLHPVIKSNRPFRLSVYFSCSKSCTSSMLSNVSLSTCLAKLMSK